MNAAKIVDALLETDQPESEGADTNVGRYVDQLHADHASGKITPLTQASTFYHKTKTYKDGRPLEVRRNGATKTWKTRPGEFKIPVKYGMYEYFYIDQNNANEFTTVPPPAKSKMDNRLKSKPVVSPSSLMPPSTRP